MAINIYLEPYCDNCPELETHLEKDAFEDFDGTIKCTTDVYCVHRDRCAAIKQYLDAQKEKEKK